MSLFVTVVSIATLVFLMACVFRLRDWIRSMRRDIHFIRDEVLASKRSNAAIAEAVNNMVAESVNATCIASLGFKFPVFMGGPSIDTHHARHLLFLLQERKPQAILELGSGSSTIIVSRALQLMGVSPDVHISIDHEERFLNNTRELARLNAVDHLIRFEHCPLQPVDGFPNPWYSRIHDLAGDVQFDFVLVDGPPAYANGQGQAREPALSILRPYLASHAVIMLDDANRQGEQDVVQAWLKMFPEFQLSRTEGGKGVAILTLTA